MEIPNSGTSSTVTSVGWLHITDLHVGHGSQPLLLDNMLSEFNRDLGWLHERSGPWHFIFFTGDLTQRAAPEQFARLDGILDKLLARIEKLQSPLKPLLLPVPGNHDLARPASDDARVIALKFWDREARVRSRFFADHSEYRSLMEDAFAEYRRWATKLPARSLPGWTDGIAPGEFRLAHQGVGVVGLNSALLHLNDEFQEGMLGLGAEQMQTLFPEGVDDWLSGNRANLLITHHPPEWFSPQSRELFSSEIAPSGRFLLHLLGHLHEPVSRWSSVGGGAVVRRLQGASLFGLEMLSTGIERIHGYSAARLTLQPELRLEIWPRRASREQDGRRALVPDYSFHLDPSTLSFRDPEGAPRTSEGAIARPDEVLDEFSVARLNERIDMSQHVRMLVMRSGTWISQQRERLFQRLIQGMQLEVLLPDPRSPSLMEQLRSKFGDIPARDLAESIRTSIGLLLDLRASLPADRRAQLRISVHAYYPPYSAYLFDKEELWYLPYLRIPKPLPVFIYRDRINRLVLHEDFARLSSSGIGDEAWRRFASEHVRHRFEEALRSDGVCARRVEQLREAEAPVYLFGGFVRDALHSFVRNDHIASRDIDLVVDGSPGIPEGVRNHFGGTRWSSEQGLDIDCWDLRSTLAFQRGLMTPASIDNLLRSTVYRLNGCAIDLKSGTLYGEEAIADIFLRRIAFNCRGYLDHYSEYQAFRAIDLANRLGYGLDEEVQQFTGERLRLAGMEHFVTAVREHRPDLTEPELRELFERNSYT